MEERLGLSRWLMGRLKDPRDPGRITHSLEESVRTHLLLLGQGWRDQGDADELRQDVALRLGVSERKSIGPLMTQQGAPQGLAAGLAADALAHGGAERGVSGSSSPETVTTSGGRPVRYSGQPPPVDRGTAW